MENQSAKNIKEKEANTTLFSSPKNESTVKSHNLASLWSNFEAILLYCNKDSTHKL